MSFHKLIMLISGPPVHPQHMHAYTIKEDQMGVIETIQRKLFSSSTLPLLNPNTSPPMAATAEIKDVEINLKIDSIFTYLAKFAVQIHNQKEVITSISLSILYICICTIIYINNKISTMLHIICLT